MNSTLKKCFIDELFDHVFKKKRDSSMRRKMKKKN